MPFDKSTLSTPPVLLVLDLQEGLIEPSEEEGPRSTPSLTTNVSTILTRWRELHYPLIHIHHRSRDPRDSLHESHPETNAAHSCSAPLPNETVRLKTTGSAFATDHDGQSLLEVLEKFNSPKGEKPKLVIMGMDGAQCVNNTTRSADDLGFDVTVVADASATFGMVRWKERETQVGPEETHDMAMSMLAGHYAHVVTTEELLRSLK